MIGAIVGDIVGSIYEFDNIKSKNFPFFSPRCFPTDDSIMTIAIAKAIMESSPDHKDLGEKAVFWMRFIGRRYPDCGYGGRFMQWMYSNHPAPYNSYGNGAAMRVSAVAYAAESLEDALEMSDIVTGVTHNHPEGLKGARATAAATWMALHFYDKGKIMSCMSEYYPVLADPSFTLDRIRPTYMFNETCQETVPQAIQAFYEAEDFEDAIRNSISIGGDSDTLAAITGAIAGAYYKIPHSITTKALEYLDDRLKQYLNDFMLFSSVSC